MPNQPKTPTRAFRISDEIYAGLAEVAKERGLTVTDVVRDALQKYLRDELWRDTE
ncbi:ribbon-helix-helix protein, CopG family [Herbiconiux liangxiaofengii]|uniref:ribbon-helix-helix protein, CopG family n=1 Tax=Herbiconiux liangxiaofengii TaxID=3342795 RepID=UPI0035BB5554